MELKRVPGKDEFEAQGRINFDEELFELTDIELTLVGGAGHHIADPGV